MNAYSPNKALRHLETLEAVRWRRPAPPVHVHLIISNRCNHRCNFCAYRDPDYTSNQHFDEREIIPLVKIKEIIDDCGYMDVKAIQLTGGGEPSVHPDYEDVLYHLVESGIPFGVVTNGTDLERYLPYYLEAAWIRVSIDAAHSATYNKVRNLKKDIFPNVWSGIRKLRELRDYQQRDTVIGVGFVVTPENYKESAACARLAKKHGADNIRIGLQFSSKGTGLFTEDQLHGAWMEGIVAEQSATNSFQVYNRIEEKCSDLRTGRPDYSRCGYQFFTTYIGADLQVYRCCVTAYNDVGFIGSIAKHRFKDLWMSKDRLNDMLAFRPNRCERCQFNEQNKMINYIIDPKKHLHEEFV